MATTTDTRRDDKPRFKVLGTSPIRQDGLDKVAGRAKFGADVQMAGLLHGKMLRSPHPHALIRSIDTSAAEALPGVKAIVTATDLPMIDTVIIDVPNPRHPFGLRGVGETPIVPPLVALANAVYDAIGVRMTDLPMSPGAVRRAIEAKD